MNIVYSILISLISLTAFAAPTFKSANPDLNGLYPTNAKDLCSTARETLAYLDQGAQFDPVAIQDGKVFSVPMARIKATLRFICEHQKELNDPTFLKEHFDFVQWLPDVRHAKTYTTKPLIANIPSDKILMTKYYVHLAKGSMDPSTKTPYPMYALPNDEAKLSFDEAKAHPELTRFKYGKQAILKGALKEENVPILVYFSRDDLESALLQGTVVAEFKGSNTRWTYNVDRSNEIPYDRTKSPYQQERYWYFKQVNGVKGYGIDADHKITVNLECTFAGDIEQLGLGKLLMVEYKDAKGIQIHKLGILADTGGAFADNLFQIDYLSGVYPNKETCYRENKNIPDYVSAYFMVLKK